MNIIVLQGENNCGKTTTLNYLYNLVITNGGKSTNKQTIGNPVQNDFSDIVLFMNKRIAFFTMGDYSTHLANAVKSYSQQNCDYMICALSVNANRPFIRANKAISKFNSNRINKIVANSPSLEQRINHNDAQTIFNLI